MRERRRDVGWARTVRGRPSARWVGATVVWCAMLLLAAPNARARLPLPLPRARGTVPSGAQRVAVVHVVDGDTLALGGGRMVRLLGVDAPETVNPNMVGPQPFGQAAAGRLRDLVEGREVALERDVSDSDHYGRLLRHVWVDGDLVAEVLVRAGLAYAVSQPPDMRHADRLRSAEAEAKRARRGLWGAPRPTPLPIFGDSGP